MAKTTKWEYERARVVEGTQPANVEPFELELERAGAEGWELVAVDDGFMYFKRELEGELPS